MGRVSGWVWMLKEPVAVCCLPSALDKSLISKYLFFHFLLHSVNSFFFLSFPFSRFDFTGDGSTCPSFHGNRSVPRRSLSIISFWQLPLFLTILLTSLCILPHPLDPSLPYFLILILSFDLFPYFGLRKHLLLGYP